MGVNFTISNLSIIQLGLIEKTLPDEFDADENYYKKYSSSSDGTFYTNALSSAVYSHAKDVINYTWAGFIKGENDMSSNITSNKVIKSIDKLFLPSCKEIFGFEGGYSSTTMTSGHWGFNQKEGEYCGLPFNKFIFTSTINKWFRSPNCYANNVMCQWSYSSTYISKQTPTYSQSVILCYCQ